MSHKILSITKRQRRKKLLLRTFLILFLFIFVLGGIVFGIFQIEDLKIKNIVIEGNYFLSEKDLEEETRKVIGDKILGIIPRDRLFYFPEKEVIDALFNQFTRLSGIEIQKDLPSAILISVKERSPVALLCMLESKECFFLDESGFIFENAPFFSAGVFLKFFDERGGELKEGKFLLEEGRFRRLLVFKKQLENEVSIVKIHLEPEGVYGLYTKDGWRLTIDESGDWNLALNNLKVFLKEDMNKYKEDFEYIDLRFENKVFYKFK